MTFPHRCSPAHLRVALYRLQSVNLVPCPLLKDGAANTCERLFAIPQSSSPCLIQLYAWRYALTAMHVIGVQQ